MACCTLCGKCWLCCCRFTRYANMLQPFFLLLLRGFFGWRFADAGWGKLTHIAPTADFFLSLNLPAPVFQAYLVGTLELTCGILLVAGYMARLATLPLIGIMCVALATAHAAELALIFTQTGDFLKADPVFYIFVCVIVLAFGPGCLSVDAWLAKRCNKSDQSTDGCCSS